MRNRQRTFSPVLLDHKLDLFDHVGQALAVLLGQATATPPVQRRSERQGGARYASAGVLEQQFVAIRRRPRHTTFPIAGAARASRRHGAGWLHCGGCRLSPLTQAAIHAAYLRNVGNLRNSGHSAKPTTLAALAEERPLATSSLRAVQDRMRALAIG